MTDTRRIESIVNDAPNDDVCAQVAAALCSAVARGASVQHIMDLACDDNRFDQWIADEIAAHLIDDPRGADQREPGGPIAEGE